MIRLFQFALSCAIGCGTFLILPSDTPRTLLSAFMGVACLVILAKAWTLILYGTESAKSLTLDG